MQCNINNKDRLRRDMKIKRRSLSPDDREKYSRAACENLLGMKEFSEAESVCVYMSAFNETDTSGIIEKCLESGKTVSVPVVDGDDIYIVLYNPSMESGAFGIREPEEKIIYDKENVDMFIVPGLAFGKSGERVGFGKGYYDKLLKNTVGLKIGFSYGFQVTDEICAEKHDIRMDYLVTEGGIVRCHIAE